MWNLYWITCSAWVDVSKPWFHNHIATQQSLFTAISLNFLYCSAFRIVFPPLHNPSLYLHLSSHIRVLCWLCVCLDYWKHPAASSIMREICNGWFPTGDEINVQNPINENKRTWGKVTFLSPLISKAALTLTLVKSDFNVLIKPTWTIHTV